MNIDFELYRLFYVVANARNITKASKELFISQPAISKSIKNLEEQLGGVLFVRTKRGVILTEEGKEFYNYIKIAMEYISNAENKFTDLINLEIGCIRIGISKTLTEEFLMPYIEKYHRLYPNIDIQIDTSIANDCIKKMRNGLLDMVILNLPLKSDNDIAITKLKKVQDCFVVNKDNIDLTNKELNINELNNYPLILQPKTNNTRMFLDEFCLKNNVVLKEKMTLASYALVVDFTKIGFGIGYATKEYIKNELKNKTLYELNVIPKIPYRYIGLAVLKNSIPNFCSKKLIEIISKKIKL